MKKSKIIVILRVVVVGEGGELGGGGGVSVGFLLRQNLLSQYSNSANQCWH